MQSSDIPATPDEWTKSTLDVRVKIATAAVLALAAVSLLFGLITGVAGNLTALRYSVLFAVIMSLVAAVSVAMRAQGRDLGGVVRTVTCGGSQATEIPYSRRQFALLVALMTSVACTCSLAAIEVFLRDDQGFPGGAAILVGFGIFCATFPASAAVGRIRRGGLVLSGDGVAQRGWSFDSRLSWSEVAGVKAGFNGYPVILLIGYANADWRPRYTARLWRIDRLPPTPMIEIDCRKFDIDCVDLLRFVKCYVENPALRPELGTPSAVVRAERARPAN